MMIPTKGKTVMTARLSVCPLLALLILALVFALHSGCSGESDPSTGGDTADGDEETDGDTDEAESETETPALPMAHCRMTDYTLLPTDGMGSLLDYEEISIWDLSAAAMDGLLASAGYDAVSPVPYGAKLYRLRYTSQDRGQAVEATAILGLPRSEGPLPESLPVALNTHGTSGFSDPCAPSHDNNVLEGPAIPALLASMGYIAVAPDYIGMNGFGEGATVRHGYLVGEQTAIGSWDAVRAAEALVTELDGPVAMQKAVIPWGGSQGGHAALFVELLAPYYAPEYSVPAVVAMIAPSDLLAVFVDAALNIRPGTGLLTISLITMSIWYGATDKLADVLTNEEPYFFADKALELIFPEEVCELGEDIEIDSIGVEDLFSPNFLENVAQGQWDGLGPYPCFYLENSLATSSVPPLRFTPTLMTYGENDDLVPTALMREDFSRLCGMGYKLEYLECAGAGHSEGAIWSLPEQFAWVAERLAGTPQNEAAVCAVTSPVCCQGSPEPCLDR